MNAERPDAWSVEYSRRAEKDIKRLDTQTRRRVLAAVGQLAAHDAVPAARKLKGLPEWRLRVGDWRVRYIRDRSARVIYVTHVLPRGRAYER